MKPDGASLATPKVLFHLPRRYEIQPYQRRYVWEEDRQWEPLWEDVERLAQSLVDGVDVDTHFMGAVVLKRETRGDRSTRIDRRIVVDGQQRLTTLQLLMGAVQEVLRCRDHVDAANRLATLTVNAKEYRGSETHAFKVWPTIVDRAAFRHAMSSDGLSTELAKTRVVRASEYFKERTTRWLDTFHDRARERAGANALDHAVSDKLELVIIDLGDNDDQHIIFETLNARGTPLLQSDMVRNKILHDTGIEVPDNDEDAASAVREVWPFSQDDWWSKDVGRGLQRRPRVDVYLNHWLTLRNQKEMRPYHEFTAFDEYAQAKATGSGSEERKVVTRSIAGDLGQLGRIYRDVEQGRRKDVASFIARRDVMGVGVITPLLLWLLDAGLPTRELSSCLRALESFLVRRAICGYHARSYGGLFAGLIQKLALGFHEAASAVVISYLSEQTSHAALWPDDKELLDGFKTTSLYGKLSQSRLQMILEGIEGQLRGAEAETGEVPARLQIEHIMPQAWHMHWSLPEGHANREEAVSDRDRAIHTIGNLTLVNGRLNATLSNAPWAKKRETLADHSTLYLNKWLVREAPPTWDETAIEKRAEWLHQAACRLWPQGTDIVPAD